jgi:hypothetical protein
MSAGHGMWVRMTPVKVDTPVPTDLNSGISPRKKPKVTCFTIGAKSTAISVLTWPGA